MFNGVTSKRRVIGFNVELEMRKQSELAQERKTRRAVRVVLMHARLARLWFDVELSLEADRLLVINSHVKEVREMFAFAFHVGVEQRGVTLASTPEDIAVTLQTVRHFKRLFHLRRSVREHFDARTRRRTRDIARMRKQTRRAPQQFLPACFRKHRKVFDHAIKIRVGLRERGALGRNIAIVKAVEIDAALAKEFEERIGASKTVVDRITAVIPRHTRGRGAEWITQSIAHRVPVARSKAHLIAHRFAFHEFIGPIVAKAKILARTALNKGNGVDTDKRFLCHRHAG